VNERETDDEKDWQRRDQKRLAPYRKRSQYRSRRNSSDRRCTGLRKRSWRLQDAQGCPGCLSVDIHLNLPPPLFIVWFGLGTLSRVLLAFVIAFFPKVVKSYAGILSTDPLMVRMAHAFSSNRWTVFCKIEFLNALPYIFSGHKIGITFAVIGIIVAEFVTVQKGLGYLIVFAEGNIDTPLLMAALTVPSIVGVVLYAAVVALEKLIVTWDVGQDLK